MNSFEMPQHTGGAGEGECLRRPLVARSHTTTAKKSNFDPSVLRYKYM